MASRMLALGSLVRAKTKPEAERVGKYMLRPVLALERLTFLEPEGKVGYRWGRDGAGQETEVMDYLEFIARVTSHIPDKGQVMVRYYGLYANAHRGKAKKASLSPSALRVVEEELRRLPHGGCPHGSHEDCKAAASACTHGDVLAAP
ncbi:MAG: transposase [Acidobacteria bacterium]|nr:transposase [Acidobacteriota bacterium]